MNEQLQKEVAAALSRVELSQGFVIGQIQAIEVALGACFLALRDQPQFLDVVRHSLDARALLIHQGEAVLSVRDGFDSMHRQMLGYMGEGLQQSVHTPPAGGLN